MFVEGNLESECTKQELWQVPTGQQLLEESWGRLKSLHALKSDQKNAIAAGDNVQSSSSTIRAHNQNVEILLIRIASAEHHELQIIEDIVYEKICAEDQQKRLKELDEMHHNCVLALREEQHNVLLEVQLQVSLLFYSLLFCSVSVPFSFSLLMFSSLLCHKGFRLCPW
jgi:hypothetical protein